MGHEDPLSLTGHYYYSLKNVPQSRDQGKRPEPWTARQALAGPEEGVRRVVFSPLCCESGAVHGGEAASQVGAGRYSQVKHQEHEARRLVGIDESDWGKRQKGRETEMERSGCILKGLSTLRQQWAVTGKENQRRQ